MKMIKEGIEINLRLNTAQFFVNNHEPRNKIREILSNIERSLSRLMLERKGTFTGSQKIFFLTINDNVFGEFT